MEIKATVLITFKKFILAGKAASHQLQLFTSKPKSKLNICCYSAASFPHTADSPTALAADLLLIKLQLSVHVGINFLHNMPFLQNKFHWGI